VGQYFERHDAALADLERARELLDPERQPFLYLFTVVGAVPTLLDGGRYREAERILARAEGTIAAAEPWWRLRFRFLAGRAAFGLGDLDRAAALLDEARQGFVAQDLPCDAAIAALELALVSLRQGRTAEVRALTRQIAPILQHHGVDREALATLALFERSVRADAVALALAAELRRHVEAARNGASVPTPREHPPS
jgi:ATP/maltotriose-dependent transcriptional regulator MalT